MLQSNHRKKNNNDNNNNNNKMRERKEKKPTEIKKESISDEFCTFLYVVNTFFFFHFSNSCSSNIEKTKVNTKFLQRTILATDQSDHENQAEDSIQKNQYNHSRRIIVSCLLTVFFFFSTCQLLI